MARRLVSDSKARSSITLRSYSPEIDPGYASVPAALLKAEMFSRPSAQNVYRQRFGRAISLDRIETALRSAYMGSMRQLTDLSRETIDTDPHLGAVLNKRFGAVSSLQWQVVPASGYGIDKAKALFYASVVREQFKNLSHFRRTLRQLAWALFDGRAALENHWARISGPSDPTFGSVHLGIWNVGWIHPRRLNFGPLRELRVVDERTSVGGSFVSTGVSLEEMPPGKFITWTPQLFGEYPEREGLGPRCLYWSFFKRYGQRERMILLELFGKPWRIIEVEEDSSADSDDLADADDAVDGLGGSYTARLPRGTKLNVVQPQRTAGAVHKDVVIESDKQMSKLVLGQTGTTDGVPAGLNSNQANVMQDEQLMILQGDAAELSEVVECQMGDMIIAYNFGADELSHAPGFILRSDLPADRNSELDRLEKALNAGMEISLDEAHEIAGFRKPERDEAILRVDQPPTPPLAPVPPGPRSVIIWPPNASPPAGEQQPVTPTADVDVGSRDDTGITVGSADQAAIMTVNEARAGQGLGPLTLPDGSPDPDGGLTVEEFKAKKNGKENEVTPGASSEPSGAEPNIAVPVNVAAADKKKVKCTISQKDGQWCVYSEDGSRSFGCYDTEAEAEDRLKQVEQFKNMALTRYGLDWQDASILLACSTVAELELDALKNLGAHEHDCGGICCALQPETVNGSLEDLHNRGIAELQRAVKRWAEAYVAAVKDQTDLLGVYNAANRVSEQLDLQPFARGLERNLIHGAALGGLDSDVEIAEEEEIEPATFAVDTNSRFTKMRFEEALRYFRSKNIITRAEFDRLSAIAKQRSFTVATLTNSQMLNVVHAELARQIGIGADIRSFSKFLEERLVSAGFVAPTPKAQASYIQNVFRTNVLGAYNAGRHAQMSQPEVLRTRPYWQIRTVSDNRRRRNHARADGVVLPANDPFWREAYPPFGFNCRCRVVSLSAKQASRMTISTGGNINYLPDPGFSSGISTLM